MTRNVKISIYNPFAAYSQRKMNPSMSESISRVAAWEISFVFKVAIERIPEVKRVKDEKNNITVPLFPSGLSCKVLDLEKTEKIPFSEKLEEGKEKDYALPVSVSCISPYARPLLVIPGISMCGMLILGSSI